MGTPRPVALSVPALAQWRFRGPPSARRETQPACHRRTRLSWRDHQRHYTGGIRTRIAAIAESIADINKLTVGVRATVRRFGRRGSVDFSATLLAKLRSCKRGG